MQNQLLASPILGLPTMPKVKKTCRYMKRYTEDSIQKALTDIRNGMSKKNAALKHNVPRSTLQFRLSEKFTKTEHGPKTYLSKEEEDLLVTWIFESHRKGFPKKKEDIQLSVKSFLDKQPRETPFKNNLPGDNWFKCFLQRHPNLTSRIPEAVTNASGNVSESDIKNWFKNIETYLKEKNLFSILEDPTRVYNGDETCFTLCPKEDKVIAPKGSRNVYHIDQGPAKTNITVMFTFSASGCLTSPMIIYPYKRLPKRIVDTVPAGWGIGASENGWMKAELFYEYISNVLYPYLVTEKIQFPVILFVDGHKTHQTFELSKLCNKLQIILISLYPNATRILQPADVSSFKPLKNGWKKAVASWRRSNQLVQITKAHFAPILQEALHTLTKNTIANGFKACGLFPWNSNSIDYSKCMGKQNKSEKSMVTHITAEENVLESINIEEFKNICGLTIINELEQGKSSNTTKREDYFNALLNLYKKITSVEYLSLDFHANNSIDQLIETDITNEESNNNSVDQLSVTDITVEESNKINFDAIEETSLSQLEIIDMPIIILDNSNSTHTKNTFYAYGYSSDSNKIQNNSEGSTLILNQNLRSCSNTKTGQTTSLNLAAEQSSASGLTTKQLVDPVLDTEGLNQYLLWPKTPERKGKRQSEKMPYVITSSGWKKIFDNKLQTKLDNQKKKDENKAKREENKLKKLKINKKNKKPLTNTAVTVNENLIIKKISLDKEIEPILEQERTITANNKLQVDNSPPVEEKENSEETPVVFTKSTEECNQFAKIQNSTPKKESHVKKLSFNFSPLSVIPKVIETQTCDTPVMPSSPKNNKFVNKGLCYLCTYNISVLKYGIQCQKCSRIYHFLCLQKNDIYHEYFTCTLCSK